MHRNALIAGPDLHRALALPHLHCHSHPFPVDTVSGAFPTHKAVPGHLPVLPEVRRQGNATRKFPQVRPLLVQHLPRYPVGRAMHSGVGHHVAPLQGLPVQVGVIGVAQAGPHVAPDVLHPALDLALGLGPVGLTQPGLKADTQGEVQHPPVPHRSFILVPAQGDHLGVVVQAAPGDAAQVLESIRVALDEGGGVRPTDQLHVAGPGPAQGHHEHPDAALFAILADVGQAPPVHLGLFTGRLLETHGGLGLPGSPPGRHVVLQDRVAAVIAPGPQLPVQHHAVLQPIVEATVDVTGVWVQLGCSARPGLGPDGLRRFQIPAHRVPGDAQFPGDPPDGATRSFHLVYFFHFSHLQQFF